jgi:hypothetical protein
LNEYKRDKRRFYYILPLSSALHDKLAVTRESFDNNRFRVRSYSEIAKKLALVSGLQSAKSARLSSNEKRRRQIANSVLFLSQTHTQDLRRWESFLAPLQDSEVHFLGGNYEVEEEAVRGQIRTWRGSVALALSRRHWSEQFIVLSKETLTLQRSRESKRATLTIPVGDILSVRAVPLDLCPVAGLGFLEVETHSRVLTLMVRSEMQINGWLQAFVMLGILTSGEHTNSVRMRIQSRVQTPRDPLKEDVYIARPICWKTEKRRVYNYRRIVFKENLTSQVDCGRASKQYADITPNSLVESILDVAFNLCKIQGSKAAESEWVKFWDEISLLQTVSLVGLSEAQRLAFFLNLYHIMVLHGSLVFGPPPAWTHWNAFFNNISYIVSFELMSIAEVEYCILR